MTRIFLVLAVLSTLLLVAALVLGLNIDDPKTSDPTVQAWVSYHFLTAMAAIVCASLVHSLVLTYFLGTGRWMEEACGTYSLPEEWRRENQAMKYRTMLATCGCFLLLVLTGALGGALDPASAVDFRGWGDVSAATIHFLSAATAVSVNLTVYMWEFQVIHRNSQLIRKVLQAVKRIRTERGLPV